MLNQNIEGYKQSQFLEYKEVQFPFGTIYKECFFKKIRKGMKEKVKKEKKNFSKSIEAKKGWLLISSPSLASHPRRSSGSLCKSWFINFINWLIDFKIHKEKEERKKDYSS